MEEIQGFRTLFPASKMLPKRNGLRANIKLSRRAVKLSVRILERFKVNN